MPKVYKTYTNNKRTAICSPFVDTSSFPLGRVGVGLITNELGWPLTLPRSQVCRAMQTYSSCMPLRQVG